MLGYAMHVVQIQVAASACVAMKCIWRRCMRCERSCGLELHAVMGLATDSKTLEKEFGEMEKGETHQSPAT
jgi:hypothetical protein